ncbi:hypothetical protein [Faecalicoccus pleomorphus]|uniref:hypothetical protein n=1 Tax=Faecalicoccus pleomorphus TaxID=1323 RepID=UPI0003B49DE1|nr:hypothetical protein [Faecalicoccus pleomorphus]
MDVLQAYHKRLDGQSQEKIEVFSTSIQFVDKLPVLRANKIFIKKAVEKKIYGWFM